MSGDPCERHPDCLFQGGCDCKRRALSLDPRYTHLPDGSPGRPVRITCPEEGCSLPLWHAGDHGCCHPCHPCPDCTLAMSLLLPDCPGCSGIGMRDGRTCPQCRGCGTEQ